MLEFDLLDAPVAGKAALRFGQGVVEKALALGLLFGFGAGGALGKGLRQENIVVVAVAVFQNIVAAWHGEIVFREV